MRSFSFCTHRDWGLMAMGAVQPEATPQLGGFVFEPLVLHPKWPDEGFEIFRVVGDALHPLSVALGQCHNQQDLTAYQF